MTATQPPRLKRPYAGMDYASGADYSMLKAYDPKKLTTAWKDVLKLRFVPGPAQMPVNFNPDDSDALIARTISPKQKGWAWRKGFPINFKDPANQQALVNWASRQSWWTNPVIGPWKSQEGWRWADLYTDLCLQYAEKRIGELERTFYVRDMICDAIKHNK